MPRQNCLLTNRADSADYHYEELDGTEYLVVDRVPIGRPMQLDGGYIPEDVWEATAADWQNVPLPVGHPQDAWGNNLSANTPDVIDEAVIGRSFNAEYDPGTQKLYTDLWINHEKARAKGGLYESVVEQIENGDGLEVSTAYAGFDGDPGIYDGEHHDEVLVDIRPDHVAVLPDELDDGRCSRADGCGIAANAAANEVTTTAHTDADADADEGDSPAHQPGGAGTSPRVFVNARSQARTPEYSGTTTGEWSAPSLSDYQTAYDGEGETDFADVSDAPDEFKSWVANHTLLGEATADTFDDLSFFPVVEPSSGSLNANALRAVLSGRGSQAEISDDARSAARSMAGRLLNDEFNADVETNTAPRDDASASDNEPDAPSAGMVAAVRRVFTEAFSAGDGQPYVNHADCGDDCDCDDCTAASSSEVRSGHQPNDAGNTTSTTDGAASPTNTPTDSDTMTDDDTPSPYANLSVSRDDLVDATPFDGETLDGMTAAQLSDLGTTYIKANADDDDETPDSQARREQQESGDTDGDADADADADGDGDGGNDDGGNDDGGDTDADADADADGDGEGSTAESVDTAALVAAVADELEDRGFVTQDDLAPAVNSVQEEQSKRETLVNSLAGRTAFSAEELREKETSDLELLDEATPDQTQNTNSGGTATGQPSGTDFSPMNTSPANGSLGTNADDDDDDIGPATAGTLADYRKRQQEGDD